MNNLELLSKINSMTPNELNSEFPLSELDIDLIISNIKREGEEYSPVINNLINKLNKLKYLWKY